MMIVTGNYNDRKNDNKTYTWLWDQMRGKKMKLSIKIDVQYTIVIVSVSCWTSRKIFIIDTDSFLYNNNDNK